MQFQHKQGNISKQTTTSAKFSTCNFAVQKTFTPCLGFNI